MCAVSGCFRADTLRDALKIAGWRTGGVATIGWGPVEGSAIRSSSHDGAGQVRRFKGHVCALTEAALAFAEATTEPQRLVDTVARRVAEALKDFCVVLLLSADGKAMIPAAVFDPEPAAVLQINDALFEAFLLDAHPVTRRILESGEPFFAPTLNLEDLRPPRTTPRHFELMQRIGLHSLLIVPLRVDDRSIGQLTMARFRHDSRPFDEDDLELATNLASHAAIAISNARLLAERKRTVDGLRIVTEAAREFALAAEDHGHLLDVVARRLGELLGDMCVIRPASEDGKWLESTGAAYHRDPDMLVATRKIMGVARQRVGEGISGRVAASKQALLIPNISPSEFAASSEPEYRPFLEQLAVTSAIAVPLLCRGELVGLANLMRSNPRQPYDEEDLRLVQSVTDHAALAIGNARSYAAAERTARALRVSESRFARLSESGLIGILVANLDGRVVEANDTVLKLVGYSRDEILSGRVAWKDLTAPGWEGVDVRAVEQLTASRIGALREKVYIRKDGTRVPVLIGSAMLEGEANDAISFVLDLTERNEVEARARLAAIVDASDDAIIGKTLDGVILSWNHGAQRIFGYAADEIVGKSQSLLVPPGREDEQPAILRSLAQGESRQFETVRRRKDGRDIDVSVTNSPMRDEAGRVVGISKVARDITDRRRAEDALAQAKNAAEAANRELEAFSYSVAHDLRAPLRGMNGFARVLLDDYGEKLDAGGRDALEEIHLNARKMAALIDALLSLSRVTRSERRLERVDLSELFRAIAAEHAARAPQRTVSIVVQDHLSADADMALMHALFDNLLGNAWKFTTNVRDARLEFGANEESSPRTFFIRDNGAGFDMAYVGRLFAPFQRLHTTGEFPGTGIGLATVQRIVHRHGGRIWAVGKVGEGAVFHFTLPDASRSSP